MSEKGQRCRVAGADPGTSSLDLLILQDGRVVDQERFTGEVIRQDPSLPVRWLEERGPLDLVTGPSGYGLPLVAGHSCTAAHIQQMSLCRAEERGLARGVAGFSALVRAFAGSSLPVVFLPGVIHLPTVPVQRKWGRVDLGTSDKLCVALLALRERTALLGCPLADYSGCVVELGSAFTACLVLEGGRIVDGLGGSSGPPGWRAWGAWDGEAAYLLSPLNKDDLFQGGASSLGDPGMAEKLFRERLLQTVAGLRAVTPFAEVVLSGQLLDLESALCREVERDLGRVAPVARLGALPGVWVKHAAQGAALAADGLAGGACRPLVERLRLGEASGTVLDWLRHPRMERVRGDFLPRADPSGG